MSEAGDKVVSDEERVKAAVPTAYCKEQDVPHSSPGMNFCIRYNDWMGLSSWKPTESEAWADAVKHRSVVAFEAQHRPASQPSEPEADKMLCDKCERYCPVHLSGNDVLCSECNSVLLRGTFTYQPLAVESVLDNKAEHLTKNFIRHVHLGKLRTYSQYIPATLRKHYLEWIEELGGELESIKPEAPEGAQVTWKVEQWVGTPEDGEWQRVVSHAERERVEPYFSDYRKSRFGMRLVKLTTTEEVISVREAGK